MAVLAIVHAVSADATTAPFLFLQPARAIYSMNAKNSRWLWGRAQKDLAVYRPESTKGKSELGPTTAESGIGKLIYSAIIFCTEMEWP